MLLTIGAMILLGNIILTANRGISRVNQAVLTSGNDIDAISLAKSTIERAQDLPFDKHTMDSTWVNSLSMLTPPASLGQESTTGDTLNDYDDFNGPQGKGYRIEIDTIQQTGFIYKDSTKVQYVSRNSSGAFVPSTSAATWTKQLDVWVWFWYFKGGPKPDTMKNITRPDTVHLVDVFSYWY